MNHANITPCKNAALNMDSELYWVCNTGLDKHVFFLK